MSDFHEMTIDELQKRLSKDQRGKDVTSEVAILHSKTTMHLSNEIASLKEALCIQAKNIQVSNEKLSESTKKLSMINVWLTIIIALSSLLSIPVVSRLIDKILSFFHK